MNLDVLQIPSSPWSQEQGHGGHQRPVHRSQQRQQRHALLRDACQVTGRNSGPTLHQPAAAETPGAATPPTPPPDAATGARHAPARSSSAYGRTNIKGYRHAVTAGISFSQEAQELASSMLNVALSTFLPPRPAASPAAGGAATATGTTIDNHQASESPAGSRQTRDCCASVAPGPGGQLHDTSAALEMASSSGRASSGSAARTAVSRRDVTTQYSGRSLAWSPLSVSVSVALLSEAWC